MNKQLVIDSNDRETGTSSDFRIHINSGDTIRDFKTVCLLSANIPESHYNVQENENDQVTIDDGTEYSVTLQPGNYSAELLAAELQSLLNATASSITFTVTYNAINGKMTISGDSTFILDLSASDAANDVLGFENSSFSTSTSHTGSKVVNLHVNHYGIQIQQLGRDIARPDELNWATFAIQSTGNAFGWTLYTPRPYDIKRYVVPGSLCYLDIRLVDSEGFNIDLNGVEWSLVLGFE